ncbi:MAG: hypothetical protein SGJ21_04775 [Alphaproteobacteria bacterium]|nr:hypothetical protein [Alphaproteobacteria bacterium]
MSTGMPGAFAARRAGASRMAFAGGLAALGLVCPAQSQAPPSGPTPAQPSVASTGGTIYEPDFFTRFAPKTALDMVAQIPGFQISQLSEERGFGQATQNVLINGRRSSAKSNDVQSALDRIDAKSVTRIEIVDGATLNIPGLSGQVANVIAEVDGLAGNWSVQQEFRENRAPGLNASASGNGRSGGLSWSAGLSAGVFRNGAEGPEIVTDAAGLVTDRRNEEGNFNGENPSLSGSIAYETLAGSVANLNVSASAFSFNGSEVSKRRPVARAAEDRLFEDGVDEVSGEIGGDYEFALGVGRLKLIGLVRQEDEDFRSVSSVFASGSAPTGQRFSTAATSGESIGRGEYSFGALGGDWQLAAEGAFNYLDIASTLEVLQAGGSYAATALPDGTARVEEKRAEANLTHGRALSSDWTVQASVGGEYSKLTQTGPGPGGGPVIELKQRDFVRPKGFLSLAWKRDEKFDLNLKAERKVGQLDFGDFISSVDINNENAQTGNLELVPDQSWILTAEANRKLGAFGAVKLTLQGGTVEDIVDQVPIITTRPGPPPTTVIGQGTGNIDKAEAYSVEFSGTLNFDPLGWKGAKLDFRALLAESAVDDPVSGQSRFISRSEVSEFDVSIRYDVPDTAWAATIGFEEERDAASYRLDQRAQQYQDPGIVYAFIENKDVFGLKGRLMLVNLLDTGEYFTRQVFGPVTIGADGDLKRGPLLFTEDRRRTFGPIMRISLSGNF